MSSSVLHRALLVGAVVAALAPAAGCRTTQPAQLTVLGMRPTAANDGGDAVLFVQVVNRAHRPMRLERFSYSFGADGAGGSSEGDIRLARSVEAGASVIVEVPVELLDAPADGGPLLLRGRLVATLDQLRQSFAVRAEVDRDHATAELE